MTKPEFQILQMAANVSFSGASRVTAWELVTRGFLSWFWDGRQPVKFYRTQLGDAVLNLTARQKAILGMCSYDNPGVFPPGGERQVARVLEGYGLLEANPCSNVAFRRTPLGDDVWARVRRQ